MPISIRTNTASMLAQRSLGTFKKKRGEASQRLSSGDRIISAGDDSSRLAIDEKIKAKIRSAGQAKRNTNDGISIINVAEASVNNLYNMASRIRELAVQSSSDILTNHDRSYIEKEVQQLKFEMERVVDAAEFNGHKLFKDGGRQFEFQVGVADSKDNDQLVFDTTGQGVNIEALGLSGISIASKESAQQTLEVMSGTVSNLSRFLSRMGSLQSRLESVNTTLQDDMHSMNSASSKLRDADMAYEKSEEVRNQINQNASVTMLGQTNSITQVAAKLVGN